MKDYEAKARIDALVETARNKKECAVCNLIEAKAEAHSAAKTLADRLDPLKADRLKHTLVSNFYRLLGNVQGRMIERDNAVEYLRQLEQVQKQLENPQ